MERENGFQKRKEKGRTNGRKKKKNKGVQDFKGEWVYVWKLGNCTPFSCLAQRCRDWVGDLAEEKRNKWALKAEFRQIWLPIRAAAKWWTTIGSGQPTEIFHFSLWSKLEIEMVHFPLNMILSSLIGLSSLFLL